MAFQFQYGTIKSGAINLYLGEDTLVSIPIWYN